MSSAHPVVGAGVIDDSDLHRNISGVDALGRSYHALNADAHRTESR